jgi:hypothetical protein
MGTVMDIGRLVDEHGAVIHACAVGSMPLPEDHWVYEEADEPPFVRVSPDMRHMLEPFVIECLKYTIRACTDSGKNSDFDPDAMLQTMRVAMFGKSGPEVTSAFDPASLVGMTFSDAVRAAGCDVRVASVDGKPNMLTQDFRHDRINLTIVDDIVTGYSIG